MKITVVIPVFNRAGPVCEAVASVLEQDIAADLVLVDDGSTDDTWPTIEGLADESGGRIRAVRQANAGPAAARNAGVALVEEGMVTFLDSDDLMTPGRLAKQLAAWSADPDEDVVVIGHERVEIAEGVEPSKHLTRRESMGETRYQTSAMMSIDQFRAVGGFDESMRFAEDVDFLRRLEEAGSRVVVLDDVLLVRRILGDNLVLDPEVDRSLFMLLRRRAQRARDEG